MTTSAKPPPVHAVTYFDENYSAHAGVALYSLLASNPDAVFHLHLLCSELPDAERRRFAGLAADFGAQLSTYSINAADWNEFPTWGHVNPASYYGLMASQLLDPGVDRILFFDCDLVFDSSIAPLMQTDVSDVVAAACKDNGGQMERHAALRLDPVHYYFNTGVMLINLTAWRNERVSERVLDFLVQRRSEVVYMEQDALNVCLQRRVRYLSSIWNHTPLLPRSQHDEEFPALAAGALTPVVLHYAGPRKPWDHPHASNRYVCRYWEYRNRSPWAQVPVVS